MPKRRETIIELDEEEVTRAVNKILVATVPLSIEQFTFCAALHMILEDLRNQGIDMELMANQFDQSVIH